MAVSGWSKGRRKEDTGRMNPNEGALLHTQSACVSPADGLLSGESWGVGAESFPCAQGGLFFIPNFTSPTSHNLRLCHSLFCLLLCFTHLCIFLLSNVFWLKKMGRCFILFWTVGWWFLFCLVFFSKGCSVLPAKIRRWQENNDQLNCSSLFVGFHLPRIK